MKYASKEEIGIYEEERRLFYVGITRAKNNLFLFKTHEPSTFVKQLLHKKHFEQNTKEQSINKSMKVSIKTRKDTVKRTAFNEEEYKVFMDGLAEGVAVTHKRYGAGVVTAMDDMNVTILFEDGQKTFNLKVLFGNRLIR